MTDIVEQAQAVVSDLVSNVDLGDLANTVDNADLSTLDGLVNGIDAADVQEAAEDALTQVGIDGAAADVLQDLTGGEPVLPVQVCL